jgi:hypothetical protein
MMYFPGKLAVLINMNDAQVQFNLPGGQWRRLIDTQKYFDTTDYLNGAMLPLRTSQNISLTAPTTLAQPSYGVVGRSIVVLEQF